MGFGVAVTVTRSRRNRIPGLLQFCNLHVHLKTYIHTQSVVFIRNLLRQFGCRLWIDPLILKLTISLMLYTRILQRIQIHIRLFHARHSMVNVKKGFAHWHVIKERCKLRNIRKRLRKSNSV